MTSLLRNSAISCVAFCLALGLTISSANATNDNGEIVRIAQVRLSDRGYPVGTLDGVLGQETEHAIMNFQRNNGLVVTGSLNPETYDLLRSDQRVATQMPMYNYNGYYRPATYYNSLYNNQVISLSAPAWDNHWQPVRDQDIPSRFARLNVREENADGLRHYSVTLNGQPVLLANNQQETLHASATYKLAHEDAVIFTAAQGGGVCASKSYLLVIHDDGTYNKPREIGNCAASYEAHVSNDSLFITFPDTTIAGDWRTWGTWRYTNDMIAKV